MNSTADPFPASEFDEWAGTYDESVLTDSFPFFGYKDVLKNVAKSAQARAGLRVLDLGTGTGNLAALFARQGCEVWATDFSAAMLVKARLKLPQAHFMEQDIRGDWPDGLPERFDRIISAYVFHHFELEEKIRIVHELYREHLSPSGRFVIADIAFPDRRSMEKLKEELGNSWEEEYYWVADEVTSALVKVELKVEYEQVSICAGVFTFEARE
jgi:putative AdoMet-dependent methyltransferase